MPALDLRVGASGGDVITAAAAGVVARNLELMVAHPKIPCCPKCAGLTMTNGAELADLSLAMVESQASQPTLAAWHAAEMVQGGGKVRLAWEGDRLIIVREDGLRVDVGDRYPHSPAHTRAMDYAGRRGGTADPRYYWDLPRNPYGHEPACFRVDGDGVTLMPLDACEGTPLVGDGDKPDEPRGWECGDCGDS